MGLASGQSACGVGHQACSWLATHHLLSGVGFCSELSQELITELQSIGGHAYDVICGYASCEGNGIEEIIEAVRGAQGVWG